MGNLLSKAKSSTKTPSATPKPAEKMSSTPLAFSHYAKAQSSFKPPLIANENAFLGDVYTSTDAEKPVSCGFYRLEKGTPLVYTYTYHEMKIIVEGEFDISDETGQSVHAVAGDVFYFPKGSVITFKTDTYGLAFYTGQRVKDAA
jgi:ethanolamine utilization protein EutQ (cupin superfamily)